VTLHDPTVSDTATTGVTAVLSGPNNIGDSNNQSPVRRLAKPGPFAGSRTLTDADIANGVPDDMTTATALGPQGQVATTSLVFHS